MTRRAAVILAVVITAVATGCTFAETLDAPRCDGGSSAALIGAQSVPSASLVVCFDDLPRGWEVSTVHIGDTGTFVVFDSDRAGAAAARFRYEESCDIGAATSTPTDKEKTSRFERILEVEHRFRGDRYYRFEGGCVTWKFDFDDDAPSAMAVELDNSLLFLDRAEVNRQLRETFVDADL